MEAGVLALVVPGLALLIGGAEMLVRGASRLAASAGISPMVVGLTVVAFGTSAPELAVSVRAAADGSPGVVLGNVVGSNIFNVLLILGASAVIGGLTVSHRLVRLHVPLMIAVSVGTFVLALDGTIGRLDGVLLFGAMVGYMAWTFTRARRGRSESMPGHTRAPAGVQDAPRSLAPAERPHPVPGRLPWWTAILVAIGGLLFLGLGAQWLVAGAVEAARLVGISEFVIGLTLVAAATSLPEAATSIVAALRGEREIAVGNIVGSNIFNLTAVLGLAAIVAPDGVTAAGGALEFDFPVMVIAAALCLPVFLSNHTINRREGALFLALYAAYTGYLALDATGRSTAPLYYMAMAVFVVPLIVMGLSAARGALARR